VVESDLGVMFVLTTIVDTVRIPPPMFANPTLMSVHQEMDKKYPNRVIMDVGLVICRYGDAMKIGDGVCVAGDGGAHHEVLAKLVVFRPFVEEVCIGKVLKSTEEGIQVSMGFFDDIFIPAYWMLRPSKYEPNTGLWVWTPDYADDDDEEEGEGEGEGVEEAKEETKEPDPSVKVEAAPDDEEENEDETQYEMELGAEIRFKVKSINFTQVQNTAKGVQAITTTTSHSVSGATMERALSSGSASEMATNLQKPAPIRKRSTSVDLSDSSLVPASMHIVASICEDGLGLTSWWAAPDDDEDEEEDGENGEEETPNEGVEDG